MQAFLHAWHILNSSHRADLNVKAAASPDAAEQEPAATVKLQVPAVCSKISVQPLTAVTEAHMLWCMLWCKQPSKAEQPSLAQLSQ